MHWRGDFRSNAGSQLGLFMSVSPQCCGATDSCFTFDQISLWRATVWTTSLPVVVKLIIPAWQKHLSVFHVELFFFFPQNIPASSQKKKKKSFDVQTYLAILNAKPGQRQAALLQSPVSHSVFFLLSCALLLTVLCLCFSDQFYILLYFLWLCFPNLLMTTSSQIALI